MKRQAKTAVPEVVNEDEPKVKRGRGRPPQRKEEESKEVVTKVDVEINNDGTDVPAAPKKGRGRPRRNVQMNNVKQEVEDDVQQNDVSAPSSRRGRKKAVPVKKEEDDNADDDQQPTTTATTDIKIEKEEEEGDKDTQAPATSKNASKGKKGRAKSASKDNENKDVNEEEPSTSLKNAGGKKSTEASRRKKPASGKENTDSSNVPQKSGQKSKTGGVNSIGCDAWVLITDDRLIKMMSLGAWRIWFPLDCPTKHIKTVVVCFTAVMHCTNQCTLEESFYILLSEQCSLLHFSHLS